MFPFRLANVLKEIAESELIAEKIRQRLYHSINLENRALFKLLQSSQKDFITSEDISLYLKQQGYKTEQEDAQLFIELYDGDIDGKLNFQEFSNFLVPLSRYITPTFFYPPNELKKELADFIAFEIHHYKKLKHSIGKLTSQTDWMTASNFALIDKEGSGCLDFTNLTRFFEVTHMKFDPDAIFALCRRLNRGVTGKVSYSSFLTWFNEPLGKSVTRYQPSENIRREISNLVSQGPKKQEEARFYSPKQFLSCLNGEPKYFEDRQKYHDRLTKSCYGPISKAYSPLANQTTTGFPDTDKFKRIESPTVIERLSNRDLIEFAEREVTRSLKKSKDKRSSSPYSSRLVDEALAQSYDNVEKVRSLNPTLSSFRTPSAHRLHREVSYDFKSPSIRPESALSSFRTQEDPLTRVINEALLKSLRTRFRSTIQNEEMKFSPKSSRLI